MHYANPHPPLILVLLTSTTGQSMIASRATRMFCSRSWRWTWQCPAAEAEGGGVTTTDNNNNDDDDGNNNNNKQHNNQTVHNGRGRRMTVAARTTDNSVDG